MNRKSWLLPIITLVAVSLTFSLGLWQLDRAAQKRAMAAQIMTQSAKPLLQTQQVPQVAINPGPFVEQRVELRGQWLAQHTVVLDNRQMNQQVGFYVVTPFVLDLPDAPTVLVQRGWIPRHRQQRDALPPIATPNGTITLQGRIATRLSQAYSLGAESAGIIRQNLDISTYANQISRPLLPLAIVQIDDVSSLNSPDGLLRNWPAIDQGVEKHLGYAFQWFLLAALLVGLYFWFGIIAPRKAREKANQPNQIT